MTSPNELQWWEYLLPIVDFIPNTYQKLGIQWGLHPVIGAIVAFLAGTLLLFGLFYLGMILAFSRVTSEERAHKAIILISLAMALLGAYYGAGIVVMFLSNIIYLIGMAAGVIVAASVFRAIRAGWYAAGATLEEAQTEYYESLAEKEKAAFKYMKTRGRIGSELAAKLNTIIQELYQKYNGKINEKIVIGYLKAMKLYDYYVKAYGSEKELRKSIKSMISPFRRSKERSKDKFSKLYNTLYKKGLTPAGIKQLIELLDNIVNEMKQKGQKITEKNIKTLFITKVKNNDPLANRFYKELGDKGINEVIKLYYEAIKQ